MRGLGNMLRRNQTDSSDDSEQQRLQQFPVDTEQVLYMVGEGPALGEGVDLPPVDQSDDSDGPPPHPPPPPPNSGTDGEYNYFFLLWKIIL